MYSIENLQQKAIVLLQSLIAVPSFSKEEDETATIIELFLQRHGIVTHRYMHNVWAVTPNFDASKPTVLLNSHHDTVKPNSQYSLNPFEPLIKEGKLFGLGSNDAGGCLVALIVSFIYFYHQHALPYNLVLVCSAEEEVSGKNGIEALLNSTHFRQLVQVDYHLFKNWVAIVGEPTQLALAVAEKGLMVVDVHVKGIAGHAAREEGENALYKALKEIEWFRSFIFPKVSEWLGVTKMTVTAIQTTNQQHNVVPAYCHYIVDIRLTDCYTHEEVLAIIKAHIASDVQPRSMRIRSSAIDLQHPLVMAGMRLGKKPFGSPTTSDKALIPFPTLKCGPGHSARSHSADEYVYIHEVEEGVDFYIKLLQDIKF